MKSSIHTYTLLFQGILLGCIITTLALVVTQSRHENPPGNSTVSAYYTPTIDKAGIFDSSIEGKFCSIDPDERTMQETGENAPIAEKIKIAEEKQEMEDQAVPTIEFDGEKKDFNPIALDQDSQDFSCVISEEVSIDIYMYHYIRETHWDAPESVISGNSITPEKAREHFAYVADLQKNKSIYISTVSELATFQKTDCFPNQRLVLLSFDDGRWDNYQFLLPLAKEFGVKANIGLILDRIGADHENRIDPFMIYTEAAEMLESGYFEILGHSQTHENLKLQSREQQRQEICLSTRELEKMFDTKIFGFVYPMGLYTAESVELVKDCGIEYAFTTRYGSNDITSLTTAPYQLNRIRVDQEDSVQVLFGG